jgi:hypothetical protein
MQFCLVSWQLFHLEDATQTETRNSLKKNKATKKTAQIPFAGLDSTRRVPTPPPSSTRSKGMQVEIIFERGTVPNYPLPPHWDRRE